MALTWEQHQQNIFGGESGGDYDALFGYQNRQNGKFQGVKVSEMPIEDVLRFTSPSGAYGQYVKGQVGRVATPVGAYQVVGSTLRDAVNALGIDPSQKFDKATQDKIGQWILKSQGTGAWEGYGKGGAAMAQPVEQPQERQGLLAGLLGGQGLGERLGMSQDFADKLAMAVMAGTGDARMQPLIAQRAAGLQERKAEAKLEKGINKTVEWLKSKNRDDLVGAVMTGVIDPASAIQAALAKTEEKTYQYQSLVKDLMAANPELSYKDALDMALNQSKSSTTINVGQSGINYGNPPPNMAWRRDSAGNVMVDDNGAPMAVPIGGTELSQKLEAAKEAEKKAASTKEVAQTTVSKGVKDALAVMGSKGLTDIFPEAGTIGKFLADYTWNQEARDLRRILQSLQANTAFTRLQEMRDASKTGGALGNVSNVELELLMSSYGSLAQDLSPSMLRTNLKNIEKIMGKIESDPVARAFYDEGVDLRGSEVDAQVKSGNGSNTVIEYDAQGNRVE